MRGVVGVTANWGTAGTLNTIVAAGGVPSNMRPASSYIATQYNGGTSIAHSFRITPQTDGSVVVSCDTASSTSGVYFGGVSWPVG